MIKNEIWLIGTGLMAEEYVKVLKALNVDFIVIGRDYTRCDQFFQKTGIIPITGGLDNFLLTNPILPNAVINATGIEALTNTTKSLLQYGVKYILLEKPGFGNPNELEFTVSLAFEKNATILLAYNRRFYQSVIKAKEILEEDGGVKSFNFEFTEWSHTIEKLVKTKVEKEFWFYGNSSHLIDLAFYLGGVPKTISTYKSRGLTWHPSGSIYGGAGETINGAIFSYIANWESPGRWGVELSSNNYRIIFRPIEKLQIMKIGSVLIEEVVGIDYSFDLSFKPGLYKQIVSLLNKELTEFCKIDEHFLKTKNIYSKIGGHFLNI